jgi:hypothetical protein
MNYLDKKKKRKGDMRKGRNEKDCFMEKEKEEIRIKTDGS